jgi:hypothetical protein
VLHPARLPRGHRRAAPVGAMASARRAGRQAFKGAPRTDDREDDASV